MCLLFGSSTVTLFQSNVLFDGGCNLEHNHAESSGAILATGTKFYVNGISNVTIAHNTATGNGGVIYLST